MWSIKHLEHFISTSFVSAFKFEMVVILQLKLSLQGMTTSVSEFNEFEPRHKSAKNRSQLSAGLDLEKFNTDLSGTNHI